MLLNIILYTISEILVKRDDSIPRSLNFEGCFLGKLIYPRKEPDVSIGCSLGRSIRRKDSVGLVSSVKASLERPVEMPWKRSEGPMATRSATSCRDVNKRALSKNRLTDLSLSPPTTRRSLHAKSSLSHFLIILLYHVASCIPFSFFLLQYYK